MSSVRHSPEFAAESPHGTWGVQALWDQLRPCWPDLSIEVVEQLESTNQALLDRLRDASRNAAGRGFRADDLAPSLLVAVQQTQGRGRMGRTWEAVPGASLTFSLSLPLARRDWSGLSLAVGLAVAQALDPAGQHLALKWPNDLWRLDAPGQGRKLGGILIESLPVGHQRVAVIGIGLNLRPILVPDETVASLSEFLPHCQGPQALAAIMPVLAQTLVRFEADGFEAFAADYALRDLLRGQAVTTTDARCPQGDAVGVGANGSLLVRSQGHTFSIISGEVSVRPAAPLAS